MMPIVVAALLVAFLLALVWLSKGGEKILAARNAKLAAVAADHGLAVDPVDDAMLFSAGGRAPSGPGLRLRIDRVAGPGDGTRFVFRVGARPARGLPAVAIRLRGREGAVEDGDARLRVIATGDAAFDERFVTLVADEAAAAGLLDRARPALLALGTAPLGGAESLTLGGEATLAFDCTFDTAFFEDGRLEDAVRLVIDLAAAPR